jgi:hypothetical protein
LFQVQLPRSLASYEGIAITRDGTRFLINLADQEAPAPPVTVRVNWPATLSEVGARSETSR